MFRKFKAKKQTLNQSMPALNGNGTYAPSVVSSEENSSDLNRLDDDTASVMDGTIRLIVHLPGGKMVEIDVDAKTPMMDLLIQVTTSNGVNPGGLYLKAATDRPPGYVRYKPSTPVGKLNCQEFFVVNKFDVCEAPRKPPTSHNTSLPFEPTIRVSIDLPQNQKTFLRLNPDSTLGQLLIETVRQKNRLLAFDVRGSDENILEYFSLKAVKRPDLVLNLRKSLKETGFVDFTIIELKHSDLQKSTGDVFYQYTKMDLEDKKRSNVNCGKSSKFFGLFKKKQKKEMPKSLTSSIATLNRVNFPRENDQKSSSIDDSYSEKSSTIDKKSDISNGKITSSTKVKKRQAPLPPPVLLPSANGHSTSEDDEGVVLGVKKVHAPLSSFAKDVNVDQQPRKLVAAACQLSNDSSLTSSSCSSSSPSSGSDSSRTLVVDDAASSSGYQGTATPSPELVTTPPPILENREMSSSQQIELRIAQVGGVSSTAKRKSKAPPPPKPVRNDSLIKMPNIGTEEGNLASTSATVVDIITPQKKSELTEQKSESFSSTGDFTSVATSADNLPPENMDPNRTDPTIDDRIPLQKPSEPEDRKSEENSTGEFTVVCTSGDDALPGKYCGKESSNEEIEYATIPKLPELTEQKFEKSEITVVASTPNAEDSTSAGATVIDVIPLEKLSELSDQKIDTNGEFTIDRSDSFPREYVGSCENSKIEDVATTTIIVASSPEISDQSSKMLTDAENESSICSPIETSSPIVQKMDFSSILERSKNESVTFRHKNLSSRTSLSSNILQKRDLYPTMSVKSFEDEYMERERRKVSNSVAERASMFCQKPAVMPKPVVCRRSETKSPKIEKKELESANLEVEYQKLQDLFKEWKILSETDDQNNNNLTTSQMLNLQRLQTKVLEQHELVQNLFDRDQQKQKQQNAPTPSLQKTLTSISKDLNSTPNSKKSTTTVNQKAVILPYHRPTPVSKLNNVCSEKEDLMSAIRQFGGVNGLRKANGKSV